MAQLNLVRFLLNCCAMEKPANSLWRPAPMVHSELRDTRSELLQMPRRRPTTIARHSCHFESHLHQMDVKYGLFEPAQMWITKNSKSKDIYDPEELLVFLEGLSSQAMDTTSPGLPSEPEQTNDSPDAPPSHASPEGQNRCNGDPHSIGRDLERLSRP
ncbi:hypothetical protein NDU88_001237 [Pleurodeles waltl]|uniref:Uncharacterized protein n=1 Tax=Pleurodeles waltl TaxID=8319 RepID=A0AAV7VZH3_PLEWA|nr:hypothetical protein NDU88_001237 [Pleurodeles waltl]